MNADKTQKSVLVRVNLCPILAEISCFQQSLVVVLVGFYLFICMFVKLIERKGRVFGQEMDAPVEVRDRF